MTHEKPIQEQTRAVEGRITDEQLEAAKRRIGVEVPHDRPGHEYASIDGIRAYTEGMGDMNPLYQDPEYAAKTRWKFLTAHPTFMLYMGVSDKKELTAEERERGKGGGLAGVHGFYGGEDIQWFRPIFAGDRLTVKGGPAKVEVKPSGMAGRSVHMTNESVYWNQRGELAGLRRMYAIRVERSAAREKHKLLDTPIQSYTPEEMARIDADYEREEVRGARPRYWEDVQVGDEIVPVVKGPWTVTAYIVFAEGTGHRNFHRAHKVAYEYRKRHPKAYPFTKYGFPDVIARVHWDRELAREAGVPAEYEMGGERIAWLSQAVTNWMGDDGWLQRLSLQIRQFILYGDTVWIKGKVVNKYVKDKEHGVELELQAVNQRNVVVAPAKAWVLLPSRVGGPVKIPTRIPEDLSIYA